MYRNRRYNPGQHNSNIPTKTVLSDIKIFYTQTGRSYMADQIGNPHLIDRSGIIYSIDENDQRYNVGTILDTEPCDNIYYIDHYGQICRICPSDNHPIPAQCNTKSTTDQPDPFTNILQFAYHQNTVRYDVNNNIVQNGHHRKRTTGQPDPTYNTDQMNDNYIVQESAGVRQPKPWDIVYPLTVYPNYRCNDRDCMGRNGAPYAACIVSRPNVQVKIPCPGEKCKGELTRIAHSRWESSW